MARKAGGLTSWDFYGMVAAAPFLFYKINLAIHSKAHHLRGGAVDLNVRNNRGIAQYVSFSDETKQQMLSSLFVSTTFSILAILVIASIFTFFLICSRDVYEDDELKENTIALASFAAVAAFTEFWRYNMTRGLIGDGRLLDGVWSIFTLPHMILALVALPVFVFFVVSSIPAATAGYIAWRTKHPSTEIVKNVTEQTKRGIVDARHAEAQLIHLMSTSEITDDRAIELIAKMPPWKRFAWQISYHKHVKDAEKLKQAYAIATKAIGADTELAEAAHSYTKSAVAQEDRVRLAELEAKKREAEAELAAIQRDMDGMKK